MFDDDFSDDDFRDMDNLLIEFHKLKNGDAHDLIQEEEFELLIDYFDSQNDRENAQLACDFATTLYPFSASLYLSKAEWLFNQKKYRR